MDHDTVRESRLSLDGRRATAAEMAGYAQALDAFEAAIATAAGPDRPLAEAAPRGGRWDATIAHWLGNQISAAPLTALSREDFLATELDGPNLLPEIGVGGVVARAGDGAADPPRLRGGAAALGRPGRGGGGRFRRAAGAGGDRHRLDRRAGRSAHPLRAEAARRHARGDPWPAARPAEQARLPGDGRGPPGPRPVPFGAAGGERRPSASLRLDRLALRAGSRLRLRRRRASVGAGARGATEEAARADLAAIFGPRAAAALGVCAGTDWASDPLFLGSYSHARPGHHASRAVLAQPLAGGRLVFAGEACHSRLAGTVAGAWMSGEAAAQLVPG
jgi:monoamine oxidase